MTGILQTIVIAAALLTIVLIPLVALIDILRSDFKDNNKLVWVIVVLFFNVIGGLLYFIIGVNQRLPRK
ncbi:PLD nuclease N-terminal domain-containing protein [Aquimarina sp. D1M17]|uniref:PLDc N-terminal domain-containing protein n=1 Tax=Aquimarina acroporae TaxID=2937283 RepID=UPI0020BF5B9F|nr:PLD nuclease N-terminal domain-containing protein [Aquimarina acroporae]MCK8523662.1 PLD nuclease N-terminal domain-containing protein [Aquimarina acroporae]